MANLSMRYINSRWNLPYAYTHMVIYGMTGCLDENTKIVTFTKNGYFNSKIKIKDLPKTFEVLSYNFKTRKNEKNKATKVFSGEKMCYRIGFESQKIMKPKIKSIIATEDHTFFDENKEEIKVKNLKVGNYLFANYKRFLDYKPITSKYKIKFIKKIGKRKTYDILVSKTHNFLLSNDILSKNSGKSQTIKACAERAFLRGNCKIIDLYSGGAEEGAYYALPSTHPFWKDREYPFNKKVTKAMDFPVNCLIPMCKDIPQELPDIFKPFTIPLNTITRNDLKSILGSDLTKNEIALWYRVAEKMGRNTTLIDALNYMIDAKSSKSERTPGVSSHGISSVYNMFRTFEKERLISSATNKLALNLKNELKNKKVITSLILKYFPEEYWGFIINYFIHSIHNMMVSGEIKHNVIVIIREAGDFLEGMSDSPQEQAVKKGIIHALRKGRKHSLFFWVDNQTPMNLDIVKTQFPLKICHFVDNTVELQNSLGDLGSMLLNKEDYARLMSFPPGRCFVLTNRGLFNPQILPPLSRMSGEEGNDFFTVWRTEKGSRFKDIKEDIVNIDDEYEQAQQKWKDILKERKMAKKIETIEKKQKTEINKEAQKIQKQQEKEAKIRTIEHNVGKTQPKKRYDINTL